MKPDGRCYSCPAKSRVDETGRECKSDECDPETEIKDDLGYCNKCDLFSKPSADGESCHPEDC
jgi:hypothetical protein